MNSSQAVRVVLQSLDCLILGFWKNAVCRECKIKISVFSVSVLIGYFVTLQGYIFLGKCEFLPYIFFHTVKFFPHFMHTFSLLSS